MISCETCILSPDECSLYARGTIECTKYEPSYAHLKNEITRLNEGWLKAECDKLQKNEEECSGGICLREIGACEHSRSGTDYCPAVREVVEG